MTSAPRSARCVVTAPGPSIEHSITRTPASGLPRSDTSSDTRVPAMQAEADVVAIDGRPLGRRAQQTRRRLLDATQELLESRSIRDVRVVDIARAVGTSPATFYQYFA